MALRLNLVRNCLHAASLAASVLSEPTTAGTRMALTGAASRLEKVEPKAPPDEAELPTVWDGHTDGWTHSSGSWEASADVPQVSQTTACKRPLEKSVRHMSLHAEHVNRAGFVRNCTGCSPGANWVRNISARPPAGPAVGPGPTSSSHRTGPLPPAGLAHSAIRGGGGTSNPYLRRAALMASRTGPIWGFMWAGMSRNLPLA